MFGVSSTLFVQIIGAFRCGTCFLVIGVRNPIHSILLLIRVFFLGTLLLFILQREYYAMLFLIVYVGAIVVLFLFIIRRLELKRVNMSRRLFDLFSFRHIILSFILLEVLVLLSQDFFDVTSFISSNKSVIESSNFIESNNYID
jgi:NADH:ubiquinone oxidoreductase subunit 6 (subunit J)